MEAKTNWKKIIFQSFAIVLFSSVLGIVVNAISPRGISFNYADISAEDLPPELQPQPEITLNEAKTLFDQKKAIFIDAREVYAYEEEHIEGAFSLPLYGFSETFPEIKEKVPVDSFVITYCGGGDCELSQEVARKLIFRGGYTNVKVLDEGWDGWVDLGYPTEGLY